MVGPDRGVHGGISAIVNCYYEAGLDRQVDLKYIGTMKEGSRGKKLFVMAAAYLRFVFALGRYDIVHVNASSDNSFMRKSFFIKAAKRHNKKIVLHQHGGDFKNYYANQISEKRRRYIDGILEMADVMLVLTDSWKEYFGKLTDIGKIRVFPNGIVTSGLEGGTAGEHSLNKILFLGRICKDKGIDELLEAVDQIHSKNPDVRLYIGGIFEEARYEGEIKKRSEYVKYLGWISGDEKKKYLAECGILALPSYYEGLPVTLLEAMLNGLVAVTTNVGGIPQVVTNGQNGIMIEPKNAEELCAALEDVIDRKVDVPSILVNGKKTVMENYSVEKSVKNLVSVYEKLI